MMQYIFKGFYVRLYMMPQRDVVLHRVNIFKNVRHNPVCDENALDINMDQSGSTVKTHRPRPWSESVREECFSARSEMEG